LEKLGIVTAIIQRDALIPATLNAWVGQGLPPEVPWLLVPLTLLLVDSDVPGLLGPKINELISYLTTWKPKEIYTKGQVTARPQLTITGSTYPAAYQNLQYALVSRNWSDGLPVNPATKEAVDWILTGVPAGKNRNEPVGGGGGKVMPKGGILTYEVLASCMAMAGGRPEYMPVAVSACETIIASESTDLTSSESAYPITVVNGPSANQIRLSCTWGLYGPDPNWPAGSVIKRAIWLVHQGTGGIIAGGATAAQYGEIRPGLCFAEDELNMPKTWRTYSEERFGQSRGLNCVTYGTSNGGGVRGYTNRGTGAEPTHLTEISESFDRFASQMKLIPASGVPNNLPGTPMLWLINSTIANDFMDNGYDKEKIRSVAASKLWYLLGETMDRTGVQRSIAEAKATVSTDMLKKIQLCTNAQNIHIVVSGGGHVSRGSVLPSWAPQGNSPMVLPESWDQLLADAERDLGPLPEILF
jgi:hypothetical protein